MFRNVTIWIAKRIVGTIVTPTMVKEMIDTAFRYAYLTAKTTPTSIDDTLIEALERNTDKIAPVGSTTVSHRFDSFVPHLDARLGKRCVQNRIFRTVNKQSDRHRSTVFNHGNWTFILVYPIHDPARGGVLPIPQH